ncbi:hypothetical protein KQH42_07200 [Streptomyces sp. CHA1]|uniref:hypothetical protein n=1 Tax=Streptomyces TaxID=1883 RepID=UPI001BFC4218|nr:MULTISPECIES: hypothetical protein [unclassified Streptomyces]MCO6730150.1 hypothetical protein [Streptomyces sp. EL9]MBT3157374.1 hypothetical protein [Streptomyces sp. G11C]MCO6700301.1 hypothetical protein [Streptomyces sp. CHB9.2]MCO6706437.1 hypothetical protein [Streptomyces sp. CHA3]MCO6712179.1 hypothetical protein [Streptomyces sp. CHB19.2]
MSPTPKQARTHRRKAHHRDHTTNVNAFRIEGSWDHRPDDPVVFRTADRKRARKIVRDLAEKGAFVIFQEHMGWDRWRTLREVDGAAQLAEQAAEQQLAAAGHPPTPPGYRPDAEDRHRTWLARAEADQRAAEQAEADARRRRLAAEAHTHARTLMAAPTTVRPENRQRARHITGAQR